MNPNTALQYRGEESQANAEPEFQQASLFPANETENFRAQWLAIQGAFVDEPRRAVEQADNLVAAVIGRLSEVFAGERERIEHEWPKGGDVSTEDLRQTFRRYRAFFDRLLSV